jgi:hypothetical protein
LWQSGWAPPATKLFDLRIAPVKAAIFFNIIHRAGLTSGISKLRFADKLRSGKAATAK